ncbi:type I methionyl aminopeptidase [Candidatus Berkelbacteria bacterium RIFOXYA2_FULL_43_10]|uniref:Methionine aminopeptidase n=1 Tax=Candidatus Berkelbacteria bacterium RIFOXYA2_FULL_43_10 TaxID=1797472 RepID=A0A1F5EAI8_9BACT|nr:MAG: type I methionyl aminopeptidase [Candidatus Berkelbacteria bacterium RIFOXYA2_FULL_43_10]
MNLIADRKLDDFLNGGKILRESLIETADAAKPGVTLLALNNIAEESIRKRGGRPSFLNYSSDGSRNFPASLCVSINDAVVHGIPKAGISLRDGDVVSLDLGVEFRGMYTDMAETMIVGQPKNKSDINLIEATKKSLEKAIALAYVGRRIGDIGNAIEEIATQSGFCVVKSLVGHGIGEAPHQDPQVPNFGKKGTGDVLLPGVALAIEPMLVDGKAEVYTDIDGWTVRTKSGNKSAHFEKTILITKKDPIVVT